MNTCELLSLIGLQLLGSEGGFIGLIGCLQIAVCCHALPFQQKHMCISGTYGDWIFGMGLSEQSGWCGRVRMHRQPAESMGKLCQLGEQQMAGWPARSAALEALPSSQRHF